jgi:hypothetical protein
MAVYGRAVSLLRQIQTILNDQLVGVDLFALRIETLGSQLEPNSTITKNSTSAMSTGTRWRDVLAAVSPSIVEYGLELARVNTYLKARLSAIRMMARVIWALEAMLILLVSLTIGRMLKQSEGDKNDLGGIAASLGAIVSFTLILLAVFGCWNTTINEMYRKVAFMQLSPLLTVLRGYSNALCTKQIVVVMSAIATGANVAESLQAYAAGPLSDGDTSIIDAAGPCSSSGSVKGVVASDAGCMAAIDPCSASKYTMAYMVPVIQAYCTAPLVEIADALIDLQQNGVDRYDEPVLWNNVNDGIDALRLLVETVYDVGDPARGLTRDTLVAAVQAQVLPVFRLPGVELRGQFVPSSAVLANDGATIQQALAFSHGGLRAINQTTHGSVLATMPQPQCTRTCLAGGIASPPTAVLSYYDAGTQTCYTASKYAPMSAALTFTGSESAGTTPTAVGPPAGVLVIVRPADFRADGNAAAYAPNPKNAAKDFDALVDGAPLCSTHVVVTGLAVGAAHGGSPPADGDFASFFSPKVPSTVTNASTASTLACPTTAGALYFYALNSPNAAALTIREQATDIARQLFTVVKQFRFALDLDQVRPAIDAGLRDYYGAKLYDEGGVSEAVDSVMHRLRELVRAGRKASEPRYVTPERLLTRLAALSGDDVSDLVGALQQLADSSTTHRDLFPAYRSIMASRVATIISVLGGLVMLTAFFSYALVLYGAYAQDKTSEKNAAEPMFSDFESFLMRLILALCVLVITLFVSETLALKMSARIAHNQNVKDDNGQMLVASAAGSLSQLQGVLTLIGKMPDAPPLLGADAASTRAATVALISVSRNAIERFDACNSITSGQIGMPLPVAELALYGLVGAVFLVLAAVCVARISPGAKIDSIRSLRALRVRVMRGDAGAIAEAQQAVVCSRPPVFVWQFFIWFGIMLFVAATAWFALASFEVVDDYKNSLAAMGGKCA